MRRSFLIVLSIIVIGVIIVSVGRNVGWWGPAMYELTLYDANNNKMVVVGPSETIEACLRSAHNSRDDVIFLLESHEMPQWGEEDERHELMQIVKQCLREGRRMQVEWVGGWGSDERSQDINQKVSDLRAAGLSVKADLSGNQIIVQEGDSSSS